MNHIPAIEGDFPLRIDRKAFVESMGVAVYPSVEELIPDLLLSKIPSKLVDDISDRYRLLGTKYLTDQFTQDGRQINGCMFKSSLQDCVEEIIDGVFNILVYIFKNRKFDAVIPDSAWNILSGLIEIYSSLVFMQKEDTGRLFDA